MISWTMRPGCEERTMMRSHISAASSMLWVTIRIDWMGSRPSSQRSRMSYSAKALVNHDGHRKDWRSRRRRPGDPSGPP